MIPTDNKRPLDLFVFPGSWVALFVSAMAVASSHWGAGGHPSRGLAIIFYVMLAAPVFGFAGCLQAAFNAAKPSRWKQIAVVLDVWLLGFGVCFWLWWFRVLPNYRAALDAGRCWPGASELGC